MFKKLIAKYLLVNPKEAKAVVGILITGLDKRADTCEELASRHYDEYKSLVNEANSCRYVAEQLSDIEYIEE